MGGRDGNTGGGVVEMITDGEGGAQTIFSLWCRALPALE